ncbi:cop9 signalosome subunit 1 [Niveomyces insectorum RCEF 264]|uniref:Cop9 signalosome subunit 1 n=1 Tax=Niveomyces insectorum RCEF 264 TaxID=1081102 RepID=A0A168A1K1_9HYPO|nr:cop9 signalosome subunit 1 [Niveomyces insectorum RCEF 264]
MAQLKDIEAFFATMDNQGGVIVKGKSVLEVHANTRLPVLVEDVQEAHADRPTRFDRLLLIGQCSVPLCIDALKAAHAEAKKGKDVGRYREVWNFLRIAAPNEPEAQFDKAWVQKTEAANAAETKRLEREIKVYKNSLVKESIRMGHEELGRHLESIGDLLGAVDAYNRMRPDVSTPKHIVDMGKHLVGVSMQRKEWAAAAAQLNKITGLQGSEEEKLIQPYLRSMSGVALLGQGRFAAAAKSFLDVDGSISVSKITDGFLSANDVAVYGGLLALATMDRKELQTKVLENTKFRVFLELEPHVRRAISQFVNGRYAACLGILASYRPDYMLDLFLQKHVDAIYAEIRNKCIINYLVPFSCVTLESMNAAFAAPGESIEEELASMIRKGVVDARLDSINKLVRTVKEKSRVKMHKQALESIAGMEKEAIDRLRRINIVAAELEVRGARKGHNPIGDLGESWLEASPLVE